jgi:hypothetical protein
MFRDASVSAGGNSLDPKCNDKYHLRADQSMDRAVGTMPGLQEITQIVRILDPPPAWFGARQAFSKTPVF